MRSFEGQYSSRKKVDLRGRSRVEESREEVLQRTREERERRRQQKLEQKSATTIQAFWRGSQATQRARNDMRETWERLYGAEGTQLDSAHGQLGSPLIRELAFFARPSNAHDVGKISNAGRAVCQSAAASAGVSEEEAAILVLHGKSLAALSMGVLIEQWSSGGQHQAMAASQHAAQESLVSCIESFTGVALWKQQGVADAPEAAASVLEKLADQLPALSSALTSAWEPGPPSAADQSIAASPASRLVSSLVWQTLHLQAPRALTQMPHLLFVPLLWQRYPSLRPLQPAMWQTALDSLASFNEANDLAKWLQPPQESESRIARAAILLGNLVDAAGPSLQGQSSAAKRTAVAMTFLRVAQALLQEVWQSVGRDESAMDLDEDDEQPTGPLISQSDSLLANGTKAVTQEVVLQIEGLASQDVLKPLIQALLPNIQSSAPAEEGGDRLGFAYRLCELLDTMLEAGPLCRNTLIVLAVSAELVPRLWYSALKEAWGAGRWRPVHDDRHDPGWMLPLVILSKVYSTYLSTFGDDYMYQQQKPLALSELYSPRHSEGLISLLKFGLWQVLWVETQPASRGWTGRAAALRSRLKSSVSAVLGQLNSRNCRRPFAPAAAFQTEDLPPARFHAEVKSAAASLGGLMEATHTRVWAILTNAPFLIAFEERAQVFQTVISADRGRRREMGAYGPQSFVTIHRDTLMQDAFERLGQMDEELRSRIRIQYVDSYGDVEAGVDGGGLFKDFMENLVKEGFNPEVGLFRTTPEQKLYPKPAASSAVPNALALFEFLGKMLGKAMYEGILLELPLASFFLKKLLHMGCDLHDLPSLDAELYKSLLFLRDYEGDVEDLALSFTITDDALGQNKEVELVANGRERPVTTSSRLEYIHRVAHFKLNFQPKRASDAFRNGLEKVIPHEWLRMFSEGELQALIGGGDHQGLDLADMQGHTNYAGGYHEDHPVIKSFWNALESFTPDQQKAFLRFVTACSRPPLLGFKYLDPALCVQMAGGVLDAGAQERLPSSSTCINLLKLPPYRSPETVRSKLLFAIKNVAGFDLS